MLIEYIHAALEKARYEIIEDDEPTTVKYLNLKVYGPQATLLKNAEKTLKMSLMNG